MCSVIYCTLDTYMYVYTIFTRYRTIQEPLVVCSTLLFWFLGVSYWYARVAYILTFASSSTHAVPHAVSGPDCAALLPAVVALAVALLTVLLLLVAAVFTAILFYTSESMQ